MKHLYYLETAQSVDENLNPIPAKSLIWTTRYPKIAWEDAEMCDRERIGIQKILSHHIIRVVRANWFENLFIRMMQRFSGDWVIVYE